MKHVITLMKRLFLAPDNDKDAVNKNVLPHLRDLIATPERWHVDPGLSLHESPQFDSFRPVLRFIRQPGDLDVDARVSATYYTMLGGNYLAPVHCEIQSVHAYNDPTITHHVCALLAAAEVGHGHSDIRLVPFLLE